MERTLTRMTGVGVAGWSYADWAGRVFPRRRGRDFHPLRYLSQYIDCMEVNSSFYAMPQAKHAAHWVELVEAKPTFQFISKLHADFTHRTPEGSFKEAARTFQAGIAPLVEAERFLALLVQFPVHAVPDANGWDRVERIRDLFPDLPLSVEFRNQAWFTPAALERLTPLGMGLVHIDLPHSRHHPPEDHPSLGPLAYLRLHGRNADTWFNPEAHRDEKYDYSYDQKELQGVARRLVQISANAEKSVVVTNNHYGGQAVANALELKFLLTGRKPAAPEPLRAAFGHLGAVTRAEGQQLFF